MSINIGIDNVARNVKSAYVGVDNVARKIKKAYVGVNGVARLIYNEDSKSDSSVMFFGSDNGISRAYLNNNKDYSISLDTMTEYASGDNDRLGWGDGRVTSKGTYFYINSTWDRSSVEFYKIEEGKVSLYDTMDQSKFPASVIGSGYNIQELKIRGCCFSHDEKHLYITTHNVDTSTPNYTDRMFISSFNVTPSGFSHISTDLITTESALYFDLHGCYVAVSDAEDWLYISLTYQVGTSDEDEKRAVGLAKINSDYSVSSYGAGKGGNSYPDREPGKIEVTPDGKWAAIYYDAGWSESFGSTYIAYLYYFNSTTNSFSMVENVNMSHCHGMRLCADKLLVYQHVDSDNYTSATIYVYNLKSNGTCNYTTISFPKSIDSRYSAYMFEPITAISRDGTVLIAGDGGVKRMRYKIDYTAKTVTKIETVDFPNGGFKYCAIINE